ncbi:MAG: preprotein translocase subunit YajC [Actinomycetota bacterium]
MFQLLAQDSGGGSSLVAFLPLLVMGGIFYFLLIRPQQRRAKAQRALLQSVDVGDEIVTTAGVYGTVTGIDDVDDVITVEIAPGTRIRMVRAGVGRIVSEDDTVDEDDEPDADVPDGQDGPFQQT